MTLEMDDQGPEPYGAVDFDPWGKPRLGDWIQTRSGKKFHPLDPQPGDFDILDIAHSLSQQCRFTGHTSEFYSIAEHSVRVAILVEGWGEPPEVVLAALLHDASEAYLCDIARPVKQTAEFRSYREVEAKLSAAIAAEFHLPDPMPAPVKKADEILLGTEARDLMAPVTENWHFRYEHLPMRIEPWLPAHAKWLFLKLYTRLMRQLDATPI